MNENKELLVLIHDNIKMGLTSTKKMLKLLKDTKSKLKPLIEEELKTYESLLKEVKSLIKKNKLTIEKKGLLKELISTTAISKEITKDNSDANIASILIRGFNMGLIDITAKIKTYKKEVDKNILKLSKELLKFNESEIERLKEYL